jgi:hypothetical protein
MADITLGIQAKLEGIQASISGLEKFASTAEESMKRTENAIHNVDKSTRTLGSTLGSAAIAFTALNQGIAIAKQLANALSAPVDAAIENEKAINDLNNSLRLTGQFSEATSKRLQEFAATLEKQSAFTDEAILSSQSLLAVLGKLSVDGIEKASQSAADLAAFLGTDLNTATRLLAGALKDGSISIRGIALQFERGKTEAETFENVIAGLQKRIGGSAAKDINTFGGALSLISKGIENIIEEIGKFITNSSILGNAARASSIFIFNLSDSIAKFRENLFKATDIIFSSISGIARFTASISAAILVASNFIAIVGSIVTGLFVLRAGIINAVSNGFEIMNVAVERLGSALLQLISFQTFSDALERFRFGMASGAGAVQSMVYALKTFEIGAVAARAASIALSVGLNILKGAATFGLSLLFDAAIQKAIELKDELGGFTGIFKRLKLLAEEGIATALLVAAKTANGLVKELAKLPILSERFNLKEIAESLDETERKLSSLADTAKNARDNLLEIPDALKDIGKKFDNAGLDRQQILVKEFNEQLNKAQAFADQDIRLKGEVERIKALIVADYLKKSQDARAEDAKKAATEAIAAFKDQQERIKQLSSGNVQEIIVGLQSNVDLNTAQIAGALSTSVLNAVSEGAKGAEKFVAAALGAAADAFLPGIGGAVSQLVTFLNKDFSEIQDTVDGFVNAIPNILTKVISNLGPFLNRVLTQLVPAIAPLITTILQTSVPLLVESLTLAVVDLAFALVEQAPLIALAIVNNLIPMLERVILGIGTATDRLIAGIPQLINGLVLALPELVTALVGLLNVPFLQALLKAALAFSVQLNLLAPQIALALIDTLIKHGPEIGLAIGKAMGQAYIDAAIAGFQSIINGFVDLINSSGLVSVSNVTLTRPKLAEGGTIPRGFSKDNFTADLSSGEEVLSQDRSRRLEDFLSREESDPTPGKLDQIIGLLSRDSGRPVMISLKVGEEELAQVLTNLNKQGFKVA